MYRSIVLLTAAAVPAAGTSAALAASSGQPERGTAGAAGSGVRLMAPAAASATQQDVRVWRGVAALDPVTPAVGDESLPRGGARAGCTLHRALVGLANGRWL